MIKTRMEQLLCTEVNKLYTTDFTKEERLEAFKNVTALYSTLVEDEKHYAAQASERKQASLRLIVDCAGIVLPLVFYGLWMKRGFKFEETGSYTSTTFRNLIGKFKTAK